MTRYFYIRCGCGNIQRVLAFAIEHSTANCSRCGQQLSSADRVSEEAWLRQHSPLTANGTDKRADDERSMLKREHLGVPLARPTKPRKTYPSRLSRF